MRAPAEHIASDGTRTWRVRFRYAKKQTSETFDTQAQALRFCRIMDAADVGTALADLVTTTAANAVPTVDDIAADHISHLTGIEDGTRLTYQRLWARTWGSLIGDVPINLLSTDRIADATNTLARSYSAKSLKNQRGLLAAVCKRAVQKGHLPLNPTEGLRLPRGNEADRKEMRLLTQDEFEHLAAAIRPHYRPLVRFLGATGCRWGEAVALQVGDLVLSPTPQVRIRRALKWSPDNARKVGPTKTKKSNRTVVLPSEIVAEMAAVSGGRPKSSLVFTAPRGGPVNHRTFWSDIWLPATVEAELEPRPRIHDIRHSHASWLLAAGIPIHVVQARLGHESITTTGDTYGHLMPDAQIAAAHAASLALRPGFVQIGP